MIRNRRSHRRVNAFISVIVDLDGRQHYVSTTNLSAGGAFVSTNVMPQLHSEVELLFRGSRGRADNIHVIAEVVRVQPPETHEVGGFAARWLYARCTHGGERLRQFLETVLHIRDSAIEVDANGQASYFFPEPDDVDVETYERLAKETVPVATEELRLAAERARQDVADAKAALVAAGKSAVPEKMARDRPEAEPEEPLPNVAPMPSRETIPASSMAELPGMERVRETIQGTALDPAAVQSEFEPPVVANVHEAPTETYDRPASVLAELAAQPAEDPDPTADPDGAHDDALDDPAHRRPLGISSPTPSARRPTSIGDERRRRLRQSPAFERAASTTSPGFAAEPEEKSAIRKLFRATGRLLGIRGDDDKPRLGSFATTDDGRFYKPGEEDGPKK